MDAAEGRSRNDWLGSRIKLWSSREMAIGCALSPRPVHGETEISNLVCSGREPAPSPKRRRMRFGWHLTDCCRDRNQAVVVCR
jgi:hypothetical protein